MEEALDPEVLDNIQSFTGPPTVPQEMLSQGRALQKVETKYTTAVAVQNPRSLTKFVNNVLEEAKLAGTAFYYRWEVWDKDKGRKVPVEGPSIDAGMCLARNYGNDAIDVDVEESLTHYLFKGYFIDLETGFTCPRLFRQRKSQRLSDKMGKDRQEDIVFQIGQSKAIRNAVVRAMPRWLLDRMIEAAKEAELKKIKPENIHVARAQAMDFFKKYGVTQRQIENERGSIADEWTAQDIVDLRGMATALKEGRITTKELFPENGGKDAGQIEEETEPQVIIDESPPSYKCPHCEFIAKSERGLKKHLTMSHKGALPETGADEGQGSDPDTKDDPGASQGMNEAETWYSQMYDLKESIKEAVPGGWPKLLALHRATALDDIPEDGRQEFKRKAETLFEMGLKAFEIWEE